MSRRSPRPTVLSGLAAGLLLLGTTAPVAAATSRWVDDDGRAAPGDCAATAAAPSGLQAAIDQSQDGDTIVLCPGTYGGSAVVDGFTGLTIQGTKRGKVVLIPSPGAQPGAATLLIQNSSDVTVRRIGIRVPSKASATGGCKYYSRGIKVLDSQHITVSRNRFWGVGIDTRDCGLVGAFFADRATDVIVTGNLVRDFEGYGVWLEDSDHGIVTNNQLRYFHRRDPIGDNAETAGVIVESATVTVGRNLVLSDPQQRAPGLLLKIGILLKGGTASVRLNTVDHAAQGVVARTVQGTLAGPHSVIRGNVLRNGRVGMTAQGSTGLEVIANRWRSFRNSGIVATQSTGNRFTDNQLLDVDPDGNLDCQDDSTGAGTAGTANTWTANVASGSVPKGLCKPA